MPRRSTGSTAGKNCSKGYSCGASCISRNRSCSNPLEGQASTYAGWLKQHVAQGKALSSTHKAEIQSQIDSGNLSPEDKAVAQRYLAGGSTPTRRTRQQSTARQREAQRQAAIDRQEQVRQQEEALAKSRREAEQQNQTGPTLPTGVTVAKAGATVTYNFEAGGKEVRMNAVKVGTEHSVDFQVAGSYDMSNLSPEARNEASIKLSRLIHYHASTLSDEESLGCRAFDDDDKGDYRALAYTRMGFSRPLGGYPGMPQYAQIRNGKIDAEATAERLKAEEGARYERYEGVWKERLTQIRQERQSARNERRRTA